MSKREPIYFKENPIFHIEILCPITNPIVASTKKERGYGANIG
jgi:hypothetical protein